jgi:hypothetical protein
MSIEKFNDIIGNQTRDIPSCSIVPQSITLPCVPPLTELQWKIIPGDEFTSHNIILVCCTLLFVQRTCEVAVKIFRYVKRSKLHEDVQNKRQNACECCRCYSPLRLSL